MQRVKGFFIFALGVAALIYLLNPGAGVFELLPDNLPLVGNLDEATAGIILLACLRYFGLDIANFFKRTPTPDGQVLEQSSKRVSQRARD